MIKMKHRIGLFALCVMLLLVVGGVVFSPIGVAYAAEVETDAGPEVVEEVVEDEKTTWEIYLEEELIPSIILVITAVGSIYIAIAPILARVKNASDKFKSATEDVNAATHKTAENEKKVASLEERLDKIEKATANTEQITRLGFCNMDELVTKGYANEISKVGSEDESNEIEE